MGELQNALIALIRGFGLHHPDQTPCGQPVAVAEAHALMVLMQEQPLSQGMLSNRLSLEKSTVSRLLSGLEKRGWIERDRNPDDRRIVEVALTEAGKQTAESLSTARQSKFDRVMQAIPEDQQTKVVDALQILVRAIHESS
ncbi:MAG: MarR family transcriptional regulator [Cyanobacteria bacterium J06621_3]